MTQNNNLDTTTRTSGPGRPELPAFFEGFAWALPRAFSKAVSRCRFEEGDILYDTRAAYDADWEQAIQQVHNSIQVREPGRGLKILKGSADSLFEKNWNSQVCIECQQADNAQETTYIRTTQGRLYAALWHGDLSLLEKDTPEPARPLPLREATKSLSQASPYAKAMAGSHPVFIMARDTSHKLSQLRHMQVASALHTQHGAIGHCVPPRQAGLACWQTLAPTIDILFYIMDPAECDPIQRTLTSCLHGATNQDSPDGFRLSAYGILVTADNDDS
ncbi:MAG: hypothetical protein OXC07_00855 [Kistimonas sp.]|nr:hypothetical protein [Kistimonas sp.]